MNKTQDGENATNLHNPENAAKAPCKYVTANIIEECPTYPNTPSSIQRTPTQW